MVKRTGGIMFQNRLLGVVEKHLQGLPVEVALWNGATLRGASSPRISIGVHNPKALLGLSHFNLGKLAQYYVEQQIDLDGDLRDIVTEGVAMCTAQGGAVSHHKSLLPQWRRHTRIFDRKVVSSHYDVSNDFYALWLDSRRIYSCAYFQNDDDTLDQAQAQKLDHICRKLVLQKGERFLDIGCGWGALMLWAVEHYGVYATGITVSQNQYDYVQEQIQAHGLADRCKVFLMDYRDYPESEPFDKIASVGMFEHVGRQNLPRYFGKIYRLLRPGGLVMNHGITLMAPNVYGLGSGISDFIEQYVFPGGELTHVSKVIESMSAQQLECLDTENLRPHYAKTLWHWVERLESHREEARQQVGERIYRIWRIYMAGSAYGFEAGWLSLFQVLAGRPLLDGSQQYPFTRGHLYAV